MNKKENIERLIKSIQTIEGESFKVNDHDLFEELKNSEGNKSSLAIKILSIFGGFLATLAFMGFLFIAGLYNSHIGMLFFGVGFIISAIWINKIQDKLITDTLSISLFIIGFGLLITGLTMLNVSDSLIAIIVLIIAASSLLITQNFILSFISILTINGCLLGLINILNLFNLIHLYIALNTIAVLYIFINEAKIITQHNLLSRLYNPIRVGLIFSLLTGLILLGNKYIIPISDNFIWISSIVLFAAILFMVSKIINVLRVTSTQNKTLLYLLSSLILLPTVMSPPISGALLIILLSFYINYKTGFAIGILSFVYFIGQFYYDLNFTLLTKSILLVSSGILFVIFYLIINKKLNRNEKN